MNTLITLAAMTFPGGWQGILLKVAIACCVAWGIWQLIVWTGWKIPEPIRIIFIVLFCILVIIWLFQLFNALV